MPTTRSSQRGQRLSDFFPAIDAPSPIATSSTRKTRSKATSTPIVDSNSSSIERKAQATEKETISTPIFDPDIHVEHDDHSHDSEEESFVRSLHFSAVKPRVSTPKARSPRRTSSKDYEVVVDYDSDSDGFAFSPVKFTPSSTTKQKPNRRFKGTPLPTAKASGVSRMVWNSVTKKIEDRIVDVGRQQIRPVGISHRSTPIRNQTCQVEKVGSSGDDQSDSRSGAVIDSCDKVAKHTMRNIQRRDPATSRSSENDSKTTTTFQSAGGCESSIIHSTQTLPSHGPSRTFLVADELATTDKSHMQRTEGHRAFAKVSRPLRRISTTITRSPRVSLTRAVSGSLQTQRLEKLPVPDYVLSSENDTLRKGPPQHRPYARLPKKIPTTVPQPFELSKARSKDGHTVFGLAKDHVIDEADILGHARTAKERPDKSVIAAALTQPVSLARGKRKFSETQQEAGGLHSPAKRIKTQHALPRPILPVRGQRKISKHAPVVPNFEFSSAALLKQKAEQREAKVLERAEEAARARGSVVVGVVPRTMYSPEKQFRVNKVASATKPQPFKFSTEARAARSPSVRTPLHDGPPLQRKLNTLHVPALKVAPFVPKPSEHPATIAASPARKLPSRLQTRREFDKVAERHAEEVVQKKKQEEELLAAERERRMNERKGWQDSGKAAIEQWAARAKINSDGKRAWMD